VDDALAGDGDHPVWAFLDRRGDLERGSWAGGECSHHGSEKLFFQEGGIANPFTEAEFVEGLLDTDTLSSDSELDVTFSLGGGGKGFGEDREVLVFGMRSSPLGQGLLVEGLQGAASSVAVLEEASNNLSGE